jgi:uncharacterized lipoprotein YmbA
VSCVRRCALAMAAFALAACASPPLVWHTLVEPLGGAAAARSDGNHVFEFAVPGVPAQVDRAELVLSDVGSRQVRVLEGERWLASLPEEIRAALSRGYARASGAREATGLPRPQGVPLLRVRTMVRRFEIGDGRAALEAEWSLQLAGEATRDVPLCRWSGRTKAPGAAPRMEASKALGTGVSAMQGLLDSLAATIALMGSAWIADAETPCPASGEIIATPLG